MTRRAKRASTPKAATPKGDATSNGSSTTAASNGGFDFGEKGADGLFKQSVYLAHMKNYLAINHLSVLHCAATLALLALWHYFLFRACEGDEAPRLAAQIALGATYGFLAIRSFMILHDCGHGSFFTGKYAEPANTFCAYLFSIFCGTPTDFGPTHALHHDNVGDFDNDVYDWAETIFHTSEQFEALPAWQRVAWRILRFPPVFFVLAPLGVWWVKFRLPFYTGKRRHGTYRPWNKIINTVFMLTHFYVVINVSGWHAARILFFGGLFGGVMGIILFHLQHVHNPGYQTHGNWNRVRAAIHGSSYLQIPELMKFFTMGIEYHHIHHMFTKVPGYRLRQCHEEAPAGLWQGITRLSYADAAASLTYQCYDEKKQRYTRFP